jgi:hypothetical protein
MLQSTPLPEAVRFAAVRLIAKGTYKPPQMDSFVLDTPRLDKPLMLAAYI